MWEVSDHSVHRRQVWRTGLSRSAREDHRSQGIDAAVWGFGEKGIQSFMDERGGKVGLRWPSTPQWGQVQQGACPSFSA